MTRKISYTDLTESLQKLPKRFTVRIAAEIDEMFARHGIGSALDRYASRKTTHQGIKLRRVGIVKQSCTTNTNGRKQTQYYPATLWEWSHV